MSINIQEIIPLTIQGEGYHVGMPCSFIRLFGCPVGCNFCDTGYAFGSNLPGYTKLSFDEITDQLQSKNLVITGGEPCINPEFTKLVDFLLSHGYRINVETSGIKSLDLLDNIWVTLSPKEHLTDNGKLDRSILKKINELKLVISSLTDFNYYQNIIYWCRLKDIPVYLQPEWSKKDEVLNLVIELANKHNLKVSSQVHKLIGVR
jgi:7-carboxy-7-deazaguanine synthase